jgi:hypothetical protein
MQFSAFHRAKGENPDFSMVGKVQISRAFNSPFNHPSVQCVYLLISAAQMLGGITRGLHVARRRCFW